MLLISTDDYKIETCVYREMYKRCRRLYGLRSVPKRIGTPSYYGVKHEIYRYAYVGDTKSLLYAILLANKHYGILDESLC